MSISSQSNLLLAMTSTSKQLSYSNNIQR